MCRHLLNAKVAIQATCCKGWFECQECHDEQVPDHEVVFGDRLCMLCLTCRKVFWRDLKSFSEEDGICPSCGIAVVVPAETPETRVLTEAMDYFAQMVQQEVELNSIKFKQDPFVVEQVLNVMRVTLTGFDRDEGEGAGPGKAEAAQQEKNSALDNRGKRAGPSRSSLEDDGDRGNDEEEDGEGEESDEEEDEGSDRGDEEAA